VVFVLLVAMQFTRGGIFSERIGDMLVNGRYNVSSGVIEEAQERAGWRLLERGGVSVSFGGLEFRLALSEYIAIFENEVVFILPDGTELSFSSQSPGEKPGAVPELRIWGKFPDNVASVAIPFRTQRSSVIRNNGNDALIISYNGSHYQFSRPLQNLEAGQLILLAAAPSISYRVITGKKEFIPADFIVPQAEIVQAFTDELSLWAARNFRVWGQMGTQTDEDTVISFCGEAIRQGVYRSAITTVPISFSPSPQRTWESAVYQFDRRIGVWQRAASSVARLEREKAAYISRLLAEKDNNILLENRVIEFLAIRGHDQMINDVLSLAENMNPAAITLDMCPGILESYSDIGRYRPRAANPFESLVEQVCQIIGDGIQWAGEGVFVFADDRADTEFNMRLGIALHEWGEKSGNSDWAGLGRSLVFSVISLGDGNGSVPVSLTIDEDEELAVSDDLISSAKLYRTLGNNEYLPHATATGANDIWAWTASPSVNITRNDAQMDISITFPVGETHYVMLSNVRPFPLLQMHDMNWRRASDFESYYDSSGWYYFEEEQILVLKIRHRANIERIRISFTAPRVEPPPPPPPSPPEEEQETFF
jgi:hypothetical protein